MKMVEEFCRACDKCQRANRYVCVSVIPLTGFSLGSNVALTWVYQSFFSK